MMKVKVKELNEHIEKCFRNNKSAFAEEIGIDRSYLSRNLSNLDYIESPKLCNKILEYCKKKDLNSEKFIFFN